MNFRFDHFARLLLGWAALLGITATFVTNSVYLLAAFSTLMLSSVATIPGVLRSYLQSLLFIIIPLTAGLSLMWGTIHGAPPGIQQGTAPGEGLHYAFLVGARFAAIITVVKATFAGLSPRQIVSVLNSLGVKGDYALVVSSSLALLPEIRRQLGQITAARCARGLMPNRYLSTRFRQLPYTLRALVTCSLDSAFKRLELWKHEGLLDKLQRITLQESGMSPIPIRRIVTFGLLASSFIVASFIFRSLP